MQTQFETCVTAFIALEIQAKAGKVVRLEFEIFSLFEGYFLMTVLRISKTVTMLFLVLLVSFTVGT